MRSFGVPDGHPRKCEALSVFADCIWVKVHALQELQLDPDEVTCIKGSISGDIRKYTDLLEPVVSERAHDHAQRLGVDLRAMRWRDQHGFDKGRQVFHFEHIVPVAVVRAKCLEATCGDEIRYILREWARVAWILKEEDRTLTDLGYRSKRPDPEIAYKSAGIRLRP